MSYIEKEALLEEIQEELDFESTMYTEEQNKYITIGLKIARNDIKHRPSADVVPVRHGEWVVKKLNNPSYESKKAPHCSECNYMCFIRYDYCPNCGAKMDGERREN